MARFSVRRPFFILVAVIIILILGGVSVTYMKTDLIPEMSMPYLAVVTADPGASPEKVEEEVTEVLEGGLASVSGVESVTSTSMENASMVFLEFSDNTDPDAALVKVSAEVNELSDSLPDTATTPYYLQISADMIASTYIGVSSEDMKIAELSDYVEDEIVPRLERLDGVAEVSPSGLITDTVSVQLNQDKIDNVNDGILGEVNDGLAKTKKQLDKADKQLKKAEKQLKKGQKQLDKQKDQVSTQLASASLAMNTILAQKNAYQAQKTVLQIEKTIAQTAQDATAEQMANEQISQINEMIKALEDATATGTDTAIDSIVDGIDEQAGDDAFIAADAAKTTAILTLAEAQSQLDDAQATIDSSKTQLKEGRQQYKDARKTARKAANVDSLLDPSTLAQLIVAQNFEMPAGYIENDDGDQWLLKVGETYSSVKQLKKAVLTHIDGVGDVTLNDIADVVIINDKGDNFAKINGDNGVLLAVTKTSTANTGDVSDTVHAEMKQISKDNPEIHSFTLMDQGDMVDLFISTILQSLIAGAILAMIVLALFLFRVRPTLIVAFSIPFSVLFALVIMYFWGLSLNIMTLGSMSLAIGMLVDNSIVVMENIYRLRSRGLSSSRAAAQGGRQVTTAVVASTLTTVSVFLPFVFASGTVQQLMVPFALTMTFCLVASLLVALTVVPALSSSLFKNFKPHESRWFVHVQNAYGKALDWCLRFKAPVLIVAAGLFVMAVVLVLNMGIVMLPNMVTNEVRMEVSVPDDMNEKDGRALATEVAERAQQVDGIDEVGIIDGGSAMSMIGGSAMSSMTGSTDTFTGMFILFATVDSSKIFTEQQMERLNTEVVESADGLDVSIIASDNMSEITSLMGEDLTVEVTGDDTQGVLELSDEVVKVVESVEGYEDVENGQEDADPTMHLIFDKNKVARKGTTVAQIYQQLAVDLNDTQSSITLDRDGSVIDVEVTNEKRDLVTVDNLLDYKFTVTSPDGSSVKEYKLGNFAKLQEEEGLNSITKEDGTITMDVTASVADGYNITLLARDLQPKIDEMDIPDGYAVTIAGTNETINDMVSQMLMLALLGFILIYLVMVAQFQSLLAPFIVIFTVPLAFTGGLFLLLFTGEQLSVMAMLGFVILMGTIVNNGIVFIDFVSQLRRGGMAKRPALVAAGRTRMRPILMTAITTIMAMLSLVFSPLIGSGMERGMAIVVIGGLIYGTLMTLFVVPIIYDIFYRRPLREVDVGGDHELPPDDAEAFISEMGEDAREKYDYESRRERRRRRKQEKKKKSHGKHSNLDKI